MKVKNYLLVLLVLFVAFAFGFFLEMVKVNINYILDVSSKVEGYQQSLPAERLALVGPHYVDAKYDYYHNHYQIKTLYSLDIDELYRLKWVTTLVGTIMFLIFQLFIIWQITSSRLMLKWTMLLYLFFFLLSFAIYALGKMTGTMEQAYGVSRKIAGALQSLVPLMLILPGWWLWQQSTNTIHSK